jgi:mannose-6-phosphate isomerase-like protein (cupin superfamily)
MKKYFIDLDNTLCRTLGSDYENSVPIQERIDYVNNLKKDGNHITIWTARGSKSGLDHKELTAKQLELWSVNYDELLMGKPDYDIYYDDKSFNIDAFLPVPPLQKAEKSKRLESEIVEKGWGKEIIFVNNPEYCGKILCFNKGKKFSMHYHIQKKETWYVAKGRFILHWIDTQNGTHYSEYLNVGDVITNERGEPHQLVALEDSEVFEVSTRHYDEDSFRIHKGN